ncbi:MAG TPA: hypothetical protein VHM28_07700, partial [Anaerolineales bacterium]|nr:hypothetical protein [Anaerolineales bacterium]
GLVNFIFVLAVDALMVWLGQQVGGGSAAGIFAFIGAVLTLALVLLGVLGLASITSLLGSQVSKAKSIETYMRGGLLVLLAGLTPYLGWFVFTPLILWTGLGAAIQAVFRRGEKAG